MIVKTETLASVYTKISGYLLAIYLQIKGSSSDKIQRKLERVTAAYINDIL